MNLQPINPYKINEELKARIEALELENASLKEENEKLKEELAENESLD